MSTVLWAHRAFSVPRDSLGCISPTTLPQRRCGLGAGFLDFISADGRLKNGPLVALVQSLYRQRRRRALRCHRPDRRRPPSRRPASRDLPGVVLGPVPNAWAPAPRPTGAHRPAHSCSSGCAPQAPRAGATLARGTGLVALPRSLSPARRPRSRTIHNPLAALGPRSHAV